MSFSLKEAGKFRANPAANLENAIRLTDRLNPGTPATDTGTVDVTGASVITGINYVGKDGDSQFIQFFREDQLTQFRTPFTLAAASSGKEIQDAVHDILLLHEVDTIISVVKNGNALEVEHTGAGTLESIVVDGAAQPLSRATIAAVGIATPVAVEEVSDSVVDDTEPVSDGIKPDPATTATAVDSGSVASPNLGEQE